MIVRRITSTASTVSSLPLKWKDDFHFPLLFKSSLSKALEPRNTAGCPLSVCMNEFDTTLFPIWAQETDQRPVANLLAYSATLMEFAIHNLLFPFAHHAVSLYIDVKMVRPWNCPNSHFISIIMFSISAIIYNAMNPGKFFHSNSIHRLTIDSIQFSILNWILKRIDLLLPNFDGIFTGPSHTQYWVGEYVGFCIW